MLKPAVVSLPCPAYFGSESSLRFPDLRCGVLELRGDASELTSTWSVKMSSGTLEVLCLWLPIGRVSPCINMHCSTLELNIHTATF